MARAAPAGTRGSGCGSEPRTRRAVARAECQQGYVPAEAIAKDLRVRGRGGTVLQPAIDLVQSAHDLPQEGPISISTDGKCDRLVIQREHAFLMPEGAALPSIPNGPVFRLR
jgi:hypothetical protein